jgi:hypothetical protein
MARARAAENTRARSKAVLIEEIARGIGKFQEVLAAIDDFSQEGFPYRDAARAKAELQLRECVRRNFGERSPEFQTYRNHKLRVSNKGETAQSVAVIKALMHTLEDKKPELQGLKPSPTADPSAEQNPATPPQMTLVPPTAQITMAPQPASTTPPMTLSVAMTTNLGTPPAPAAAAPQSPPPVPELQSPIAPAPAPSVPLEAAPATQSMPPRPTPPAPTAAQSHSEVRPIGSAHTGDKPTLQSETHPPPALEEPSAVHRTLDTRSILPRSEQDSLELLRKVCIRFHAVARQLRLRKDYRATLEVEDDYDLQDLLCALLKVEFDEVGADEWTPPYTGGAPRTALFLNREQIAVVAKKTRPGLTTKELADQVAADSAYFTARDKCATLFCFIYDPEGRIGSPKRLETDLTSVSDRYTVEVLVAPK